MNAINKQELSAIDPDDIGHNPTNNTSFEQIVEARLSRRNLFKAGAGTMATTLLGSMGLAACGGGGSDAAAPAPVPPTTPTERLLAFNPVAKSLADMVSVPAGYTATILYALGDPLRAATPAYRNDGTDTDFENRAGDHHDGMEYFGLNAAGQPDPRSNDRGLLGINHEATTDEVRSSFFLHANGGTTTLPRPASEIDKEIAIHGVSVVEMRKNAAGTWGYVQNSPFNFRLTALTEMEIGGPGRGDALMRTRFSPDGTRTRGTLNNCGTGYTPWGTMLTGEENWAGYFTRSATDNTARSPKSVTALNRYGRAQGAASRHGWESGGTEDRFARWNISQTGTSTDGTDDYRNELNGMGYMVEVDVYNRTRLAKKRTALGRYAHESAGFSKPVVGQPLAVYMGDDSQNEYIYKFVSTAVWSAADANPTDRIATGDKYLDSGRLYAARFNADGTGEWLELSITNPLIANYAPYSFANQADVSVNSRLAADAVGATRMDRPEWGYVNPANGEVYIALTNNSNRRVDPTGTQTLVNAANPRAYTDLRGTTTQAGNVNGHVIRFADTGGLSTATTFRWDIYLFGAQSDAGANINLSGLSADQDFSSPDGLVFSNATGICWFQTDDGAYIDVTNCMMVAGLPGQVGDGERVNVNYTRADGTALVVQTPVGRRPTADTLKRFLVGPVNCEITGLAETPDGKSMFINIQHAGERTLQADILTPARYTSHWPGNAGYGAGGALARPRSATIVITKNDGGRIGT